MLRNWYLNWITLYFRSHPIVAILGPRQCGKTTLARQYFTDHHFHRSANYFDLEDQADLIRLENPKLALEPLEGLIVIDEIQRVPDLFTTLRVIVDNPQLNQRYLILGSASRELIRQSSESLAGRIAYLELPPFSFVEVQEINTLWIRGGFPRSYLAETLQESIDWREFYITTFLEQDIPGLGIQIPATSLRRFWSMLAHYHSNVLNASELGRSFGRADTTVRRYLDILSGTFMIRQLQPWFENSKKRQIKSPKIYFRDSGLLHTFMNITDKTSLARHPKLGASWEGFALEEIIRAHQAATHQCYFWATHSGAELDLLIFEGGKRLGFEFKYSDAPKLTKSMCISVDDLQLDRLVVIYPGEKDYLLTKDIHVRGLKAYLAECYSE